MNNPNQRLLILACSATKSEDPRLLTALNRYQGPLWQTLRVTDPEQNKAQCVVISAKYGLRTLSTPIKNYDARLTRSVANDLIESGIHGYWPKPLRKGLPWGPTPCAAIASLTEHGKYPFSDIALCGGELYIEVMQSFVKQYIEEKLIQHEARITVINGPIGIMRRELASWLNQETSR